MPENLYALKFYSESLHRNLSDISHFTPSVKNHIVVWSEKNVPLSFSIFLICSSASKAWDST